MTKIKLFHVGFDIIEDPDIYYGKKNADFGQGFYLSDDEDFAHRWAKTKPNQSTYVNTYEIDFSDLKIKKLERNEEWFRYIFDNRRFKEDTYSDYDVICGPIANDTIYDVMGITTSGFLKEEEALELLQVGNIYNQVAIKTTLAKSKLKWLGYEELEEKELLGYRSTIQAEEAEFQKAFSEKMAEMMGDD